MKRLFSRLLSVLLLSIVCSHALAGFDFSIDSVNYIITSNQSVEVYSISNPNALEIIIPKKVTYEDNEYYVTSIGMSAFYNRTNLVSIIIPNSVTWIGTGAFRHCKKLNSIVIPNSVTFIGMDAFDDCTNLKTVFLGKSTEFATGSYASFPSWTNIYYNAEEISLNKSSIEFSDIGQTQTLIANITPSDASQEVIWESSDTEVAVVNDNGVVRAINGGNAVITATTKGFPIQATCDVIVHVRVSQITISQSVLTFNSPNSTQTLAATITPTNATNKNVIWSSSNTSVAEVSQDGVVKAIGNGYAYIKATAADGSNREATCFVRVEIPDYIYVGGIYYLPYSDGHAEVTNMALGSNPGEGERTEYAGTINIPANVNWNGKNYNVTGIHEYAFKRMKDLQSVVIPASVSVIKHQSFCNSPKLARVIFMNADKSELTDIQDSAFYGCSVLNNVTLPNSTLLLGKYSFADCVALSKITLSNKLSFIDEYAFSGCTELSSIILPESLNSIQNYAFSNDKKLSEITFPSGLEGIGAGCFLNCSAMQTVTFNTTIATMTVGADAFDGCTKLNKVNVKDLGSLTHTNFNTEKSNPLSLAHHLYQNDNELTTATVPEGTMYVNNYAFSGCTSLKEIKLPSTILYVNDNIFYNCTALTTVRCKAEIVPPFLGTDDPTKMNNVFSKATLYVPKDVVDDYKYDDWWKRFKSVKEDTNTQKSGDVDGNGTVNSADVVAIYNFILGGEEETGIAKALADVDGNGDVNSGDVVAVYNIIIGGGSESKAFAKSGGFFPEANITGFDNVLTVHVGNSDDKAKIPVSVYLANPTTSITSVEVNLKAPIAPTNFGEYDEDEGDYIFETADKDRFTSSHTATIAAGTKENPDALFISITSSKTTNLKGTEGKVITVFLNGSELAAGTYTIDMVGNLAIWSDKKTTEIYESEDTSDTFTIGEDGKVTAVKGIAAEKAAKAKGFFTVDGKKVAAPQKGQIYVKDGKVVKF